MGLRFRKRIGLGPVKFNITGKGISSVSVGSPGATVNLPVASQHKPSVTVGLPGTGLSYRETLTTEQQPSEEQQPSLVAPVVKVAAGVLVGKLLVSVLFGGLGRHK